MNTFSADFSSSPVSDQLPRNTPQKRPFLVRPAEPSTTPAAPPPSTIFGSSDQTTGVGRLQFGQTDNKLQPSQAGGLFSSHQFNHVPTKRPTFAFDASTRSSAANTDITARDDDNTQETDNDDTIGLRSSHPEFKSTNPHMSAPSLLKFSSNSIGRSGRGPISRQIRQSRSRLPRRGSPDVLTRLAKDLTRKPNPPSLTEGDSTIVDTEQVLRQLDAACQASQDDLEQSIMISGATRELLSIWKQGAPASTVALGQGHIGPAPSATHFQKARYVTDLLLSLHTPGGDLELSAAFDTGRSLTSTGLETKPVPKILLEWMAVHHTNYTSLLDTVMRQAPNPAASEFFWDAVHTFVLRGAFVDLMRLLAEADFQYAVVEGSAGFVKAKFSGIQLQAVQGAIYQVRQTINACPGLRENDWRIDGQEWDLYRKQVEDAIESLTEQTEEHDDEASDGLRESEDQLVGLPYVIYQHILTIYNILLGDTDVILGLAQDWLEASLFLTIWWNGSEDAKVAQWSFDVSRASQPDANYGGADPYLCRLKDAFLCVTDTSFKSNFRINSVSPIEVALGCVLQGEMQFSIRIIRTLSLCVASAAAEIGTWSGWLRLSSSTDGLDQQDLVVLNYGDDITEAEKDSILLEYAAALFQKETFVTPEGSTLPGWELAFSVTSRLDETDRIQTTISDFLKSLPVTDPETAQKLIAVCTELGLVDQGRKVSEAFGDHLVNTTSQYGTALLCYARSHSHEKVRQLVDLLNSFCLVQSRAYPQASEMDEHLSSLVSNPRSALASIVEVDPVAAETLQYYLVGYACLRKFYTVRDNGVAPQRNGSTSLPPSAQTKVAAKALVAAINSAADSIYGGLYDPARQSAIQVDGLLSMLGEATALLSHDDEPRVFSDEQMYAILAATEDLETVNDAVYRANEDCMLAALRHFHGSAPPSPHAMLKKSLSSGTNSNFSFSLMGSEMLTRSGDSLGGKSFGSAIMVGDNKESVHRGWDWRARFDDTNITAKHVLSYLRLGIARELSLAILENAN